MCITRKEMDSKINEIRQLKAMREEIDQSLSALQNEVIEYFKVNELEEVIGDNFKATYKMQSRETLDKKKLESDLGDLSEYTKVTSYPVLRIK